ncbi:NADH-ubiquinone oxidoreductase [Paracoccidioides lutzii Pb01]|uniref:NADH-ubiquinone oxidoreductase n=2 Tax=Paracoccidioides TaxID=38946 RepID=C1HA62_PARBA|nr:NADH-ubiquinone oxidoreductase [Paracoccidioides lutzii Pb01]AAN87885.1 NADH-ubiquinone oxidoreductase [Paracoccidioides brasiliensis]EEH37235.1 NADH-ubiquinone oxidoreductase [Paracoccidioides lutzii Pb01]
MLSSTRSRLCLVATGSYPSRLLPRGFTTSASNLSEPAEHAIPTNNPNLRQKIASISETNAVPVDSMGAQDAALQESTEEARRNLAKQAPNRTTIWAKSQQPREKAMTGPRFEQTVMEYQPRPYAAIELIHKQPVRWTKEKVVSCDGGGGPLGHPRIFINTDKPQICMCEYCGLPFANEHNRKALEALPQTSYPLESLGDPAGVNKASSEQR